MQTMERKNEPRMVKQVDNRFTAVKSPSAAAWKVHTEPDLTLEDISEEELKQIVDAAIVKQFKYGVDNLFVDGETKMEKLYNIYHRERPLTIPPNMNGLVGSRVFWQGKDESLMSDFIFVECQNTNRFTHQPSTGLAPRSLMAQRLYSQMMELSKKKVHVGCSNTKSVDCGRELLVQNGYHTGESTGFSRQRNGQKQKSVRSRVMKFLRRLSCCNGKSVEE